MQVLKEKCMGAPFIGGIGVYNTQILSNPSNSRESNNEERD
jgi:hypothetical protein